MTKPNHFAARPPKQYFFEVDTNPNSLVTRVRIYKNGEPYISCKMTCKDLELKDVIEAEFIEGIKKLYNE